MLATANCGSVHTVCVPYIDVSYIFSFFKNVTVSQSTGPTALCVCVRHLSVCVRGQEEVIIRESSARSLHFLQRILFHLLFAICLKKKIHSLTSAACLIFWFRHLQKCQQMETAPWDISQAHLIPERPSALLLSGSHPAPVSPDETSYPRSVD